MAKTLFDAEDGQRVRVRISRVAFRTAGREMGVDRLAEVEATATGEFRDFDGVRRRKFVDVEPPVREGSGNILWLTDRPLDAEQPETHTAPPTIPLDH